MYVKIKCEKNKNVVRYIDKLTIETFHAITEISKFITYILSDIFV